MIKNNRGSALAIVLLSISIMAMMMYVLSQVVIDQQKSINNYEDIKIAENYAKSALLSAESRVYYFDAGKYSLAVTGVSDNTNYNAESPTATCCKASKGSDIYRRYLLMKHTNSNIDLINNGLTCNSVNSFKGICYSLINSVTGNIANYNSDSSWQPWLASVSGTVKPCNSYSNTTVPMIDDKTYRYSWRYITNDSRLCTDPRMIVEPINLAYRGSFRMVGSIESDYIIQSSGAQLTTYKENNGSISNFSPRLYRITVVSFGRNGDTKVTLQEVVMINNFNNDLRISGDSLSNLSNRIVRLSTRWLN